jgi:hypothetical protein
MPSITLTYADLAARLGRSEDAAKSLAKRKRWKRSTGNDGLARITIDEGDLADMANPDRRGIGRPPANATWTKSVERGSNPVHDLQAKLAVAEALAAERARQLGLIRDRLTATETRLNATQDELLAMAQKVGSTETQVAALHAALTAAERDRDRWHEVATLKPEPVAPVERRSWWRRLAG